MRKLAMKLNETRSRSQVFNKKYPGCKTNNAKMLFVIRFKLSCRS